MNKSINKPRRFTKQKRRLSPIRPNETIDYKDVGLLRKFITDQGKILSRRVNRLTSKQQRAMTQAIKKARILALLPFLPTEK